MSLQLCFYIHKINQHFLQRRQLAYIIAHKVQTQKAIKDHYVEKFDAKTVDLTSTQNSEPFDKARKEKKKEIT